MARRRWVSVRFVNGTVRNYILLYALEHVYIAQSEDYKIQLLSKSVVTQIDGDSSIEDRSR